MNNLEKAIAAARQFGGGASANNLVSWSQDDRRDIAAYYGAEKWSDISEEHRSVLFLAYRHGERRQSSKTFAELLVAEQTKDWEAEDWKNEHPDRLVEQAEEMLDENSSLYGDMFRAMLAFERRMGW